MSNINAGDIVRLKSGSKPVMTVGYLWSKSLNGKDVQMAFCQWFTPEGELKDHSFLTTSLGLV